MLAVIFPVVIIPCDRCVYMYSPRQLMRKDLVEHGVLRDLWVFSFLRAAYGAEAMQSAQSERELHLLWVKQVDVYVCGRREQREWYKVKRGRKMMCCWCFTVYVLCLQVCPWCLCRPLNVSVKADHRWSVLSMQPCSWITTVSGLIHTHTPCLLFQ